MANVSPQALTQLLSSAQALIESAEDPQRALSLAADCVAHLTLASTLSPRERKDFESSCEQMLGALRAMPSLREYDTSALCLRKGKETQLFRDILFWRDTLQWQGRRADKESHRENEDRLRTFFDQAKQSLESGDILKAKRYLHKFCELHQQKARAVCSAASLLISLGKDRDAVSFLQEALQTCPAQTSHVCLLVVTLNRLGQQRQAIDVLRAYAKAQGASPEIHLSLAALYLNMGRFPEARKQARKAMDTIWQTQCEHVQEQAHEIMDYALSKDARDCLPQDEETMFGVKDAKEKMLASLKRKVRQEREP